MRKIYAIALMAISMPFLALAQFRVSGKVIDASTEQSLPGASIRLGKLSSQTVDDGSFAFPDVKAGSYTLQISFLGYATYTETVIVQADKSLIVKLSPASTLADEVIVRGTRASAGTPTTFRNIGREELQKNNLGQDLPYLLNQTPSVVVSSDAGTGIGYTGIRIRGSDPTRINVTLNGIPYNDPESQGTYFVDIPDFASSVDNIQIQRGVGTSTNGAGAFGGSLNIQTTTKKDSAYAELTNAVGSFATVKNTVSVGTGLIDKRFTFDGRLSRIKSDGYIDRGSSDLKSYFLSGAFYGAKDLLRANVFSGKERTYQAWNGVPEAKLKTDRTFNGFTYDDQTDNYTQDHYQLLYTHSFLPSLSSNIGLHYTYGRGYYEEFKDEASLASYGISPVSINGTTIENSNLIRRRWLDNDFYGLTYSLNYQPVDSLDLTLGGAYNEYDGSHFGEVIWAQYASDSKIRQRYYDGKGFKTDFNVYGRADYRVRNLDFYGDLQYRRVNHSLSGTDKNRNLLDQRTELSFFNPKVGLSYTRGSSTVYASFAIANKEPNRDDYVNAVGQAAPKPEKLKDVELGYRAKIGRISGGINGYGMFYKDQLVLTGRINDVGEYIRENVPDSYRLGAELDARAQISRLLSWGLTATLSRNKVKQYTEYIDDYDNGGQISNSYRNTDIAYSPSFIGSSELSLQALRRAEVALLTKYVGKQYLDNTSNEGRSINSFLVNDLRLRYNTSFKQLKNVALTLLVNNVFGEIYESNGYTFSYIYGGFTTENYYYPQAGRNFLLQLSLKF